MTNSEYDRLAAEEVIAVELGGVAPRHRESPGVGVGATESGLLETVTAAIAPFDGRPLRFERRRAACRARSRSERVPSPVTLQVFENCVWSPKLTVYSHFDGSQAAPLGGLPWKPPPDEVERHPCDVADEDARRPAWWRSRRSSLRQSHPARKRSRANTPDFMSRQLAKLDHGDRRHRCGRAPATARTSGRPARRGRASFVDRHREALDDLVLGHDLGRRAGGVVDDGRGRAARAACRRPPAPCRRRWRSTGPISDRCLRTALSTSAFFILGRRACSSLTRSLPVTTASMA